MFLHLKFGAVRTVQLGTMKCRNGVHVKRCMRQAISIHCIRIVKFQTSTDTSLIEQQYRCTAAIFILNSCFPNILYLKNSIENHLLLPIVSVCVCVRAEKISKMQRQNDSNGQNVDESFEVKTYFYIGAYQQCLNEINKLRVIFFHFEHRFLMGPHFNQYKSIAGQQFAKGLFYVACIYCTT